MKYNVQTTDTFKKEAKRLLKKYPSLKDELTELSEIIAITPNTGTSLGNNVYKIRLAVKSKGKGKRGGMRVITQVKIVKETVYLFSIYSKGEAATISDSKIKECIQEINKNFN